MRGLLRPRKATLKGQIIQLLTWFSLAVLLMQSFFVFVFAVTNTRNYSALVQSTVGQLSENLFSFAGTLKDVANILTFNNTSSQLFGSEPLSTKVRLLRNTELTIDSIRSSNPGIDAIMLTDFDMLYLGDSTNDNFWILKEIRKILESRSPRGEETRHLRVSDPADKSIRFVRVTPSPLSEPGARRFYTIIIYNVEALRRSVSNLGGAIGTYFIVPEGSDRTIELNGANSQERRSRPAPWNRAVLGTDGLHQEDGAIFCVQSVKEMGLKLVGMVPTGFIWRDIALLQLPNLIMIGIIMTLLIIEGWIIIRNITTPISHMAQFMGSIGDALTAKRLELKHSNEIGLLANDINAMLDKIGAMTENIVNTRQQLYQTKLAKQQAELAAFQSQVNPHFLYNTLDCIRGMAISQDIPEIGRIATSMVRIFRYSVKQGDRVLVKDELQCIQQYLTIMQIRHDNRFHIIIEVDEAAMNAAIPKMVLQPLVENALIHGLEQRRGPGTLRLRGMVEASRTLVLEVEDDGKGMEPETLDRVRAMISSALSDDLPEPSVSENKSVGLLNIEKRLKLSYGEALGLELLPAVGRGVLVRIRAPYLSNA